MSGVCQEELGNAGLARGKEGNSVTILEGRGGGGDKQLVVTGSNLRLGSVLCHWRLSGGTPTGQEERGVKIPEVVCSIRIWKYGPFQLFDFRALIPYNVSLG